MSGTSIPKGSGTVLVVEDEEILLQAVETMLKICGYTPLLAQSAERALEIFAKEHGNIDGILLDMILPRMSCEDLYTKLKEIDPEVTVVLASGYRQDEGINRLLDSGIKGFVQKPYDLEGISQIAAEFFSQS